MVGLQQPGFSGRPEIRYAGKVLIQTLCAQSDQLGIHPLFEAALRFIPPLEEVIDIEFCLSTSTPYSGFSAVSVPLRWPPTSM